MGCTPLSTIACGLCSLHCHTVYQSQDCWWVMMEYVRSHPGAIPWKLILSSAFTSSFEITMAYATVAYLNDWLLFDRHPLDDQWGVSQSWFLLKLVYLGFKIDNYCQMTIQFILAAHDQLVYLLWYKRQGSLKDRQNIACYTQWILFNLQLPHFLAKDILLGDTTRVLAILCDLSVLSYNPSSSWMDNGCQPIHRRNSA